MLLACAVSVLPSGRAGSGEAVSKPVGQGGILLWQPRFDAAARQDPSPPGLSDHPHLRRLSPPDCGRLRDLLAGDEETYRAAMVAWDHFLLRPCLLHALRLTARPAGVEGIDMDGPVPDILARLDLSSFRSSLGPSLPEGRGLVPMRAYFGAADGNPDLELTIRADGFDYLSRRDDKDDWLWTLSLLAAADWTGDGKGEVLVSWEDDSLGQGTYLVFDLLFLSAAGAGAPIRAVHVQDWLYARRAGIIPLLE